MDVAVVDDGIVGFFFYNENVIFKGLFLRRLFLRLETTCCGCSCYKITTNNKMILDNKSRNKS